MAGLIFDYFDGYLRVDFRSGPWLGDIEIIFHVSGDTASTTPCDIDFKKGKPAIAVADDVMLRCWTSSSMSYFFRDMVSWLEAVTCNVHECAFHWDGEGPEGELRWFGGARESGTLRMSWTGRRDSAPFDHSVRLEKSKMVRSLYQALRVFAESEDYDPISYESLTYGEIFDLVLIEGRKALTNEIIVRDGLFANKLMQAIFEFSFDFEKGYPRRASLAEFIDMAGSCRESRSLSGESELDQLNDLFGEKWECLSAERRRRYVEDDLYSAGGRGGCGENLRVLRSPLIESWLAEQDSHLTGTTPSQLLNP